MDRLRESATTGEAVGARRGATWLGPLMLGIGLLALACLPADAEAGADAEASNYLKYDAVVTDSKGVRTTLTNLGFDLGASVLRCSRGDGLLDIPFRNIRSVEIGSYVAERGSSPATVLTRKGTRVDVEISKHEGLRYLGGDTEFGRFRIRLEQVRKLELGAASAAGGSTSN